MLSGTIFTLQSGRTMNSYDSIVTFPTFPHYVCGVQKLTFCFPHFCTLHFLFSTTCSGARRHQDLPVQQKSRLQNANGFSNFSIFLCFSFNFYRLLSEYLFVFFQNDALDPFTGFRVNRMCDIPVFTVGCFTAGHGKPFSPSITLMSCTTNSSSIVMETTAFILPSFATLLTLTSVMFIKTFPFHMPFLKSPAYDVTAPCTLFTCVFL